MKTKVYGFTVDNIYALHSNKNEKTGEFWASPKVSVERGNSGLKELFEYEGTPQVGDDDRIYVDKNTICRVLRTEFHAYEGCYHQIVKYDFEENNIYKGFENEEEMNEAFQKYLKEYAEWNKNKKTDFRDNWMEDFNKWLREF